MLIEHYKCFRCGADIDKADIDEEEYDDSTEIVIRCKECGTSHELSIPKEYDGQGFLTDDCGYCQKCPVCGSYLILSSNNMLSELIGEDLPEDQDAMTENSTCPNCGTYIMAIPVPPSEEANYQKFNTQ